MKYIDGRNKMARWGSMLSFSELAKEAHALLNSESKEQKLSFQKSKNAIKQLFVSSEIPYKQLVLLRLGIIDDFYSTNINKSNDAIFILSDDIVNMGDDKVLKEKFMHFYNDEKCQKYNQYFKKKLIKYLFNINKYLV